MQCVSTSHIIIDDHGTAWIEGTRTKVMHLIASKQAYGWSPEEMKRQYPHLDLAEIYAALSYYHDNPIEVDAQIFADRQRCEELSKTTGPQPFNRKG